MLRFPWLHKPVVKLLIGHELSSLLCQELPSLGQSDHFNPLRGKPSPIVSGGYRIDPNDLPVTEEPKVRRRCAFIATIDGLNDVLYCKNSEPRGFRDQLLFFRTQAKSANVEGDALARATRAMFLLAASLHRFLF